MVRKGEMVGFHATKFKSKAVAVAVGALFGFASGAAMADSTFTVTSGNNLPFNALGNLPTTTQNLIFTADVTATAVTAAGIGNITINTGDGAGTVSLNGGGGVAHVVTGTIGSTTSALGKLALETGATASLTNSVFVKQLLLGGNGSIAQVASGTIGLIAENAATGTDTSYRGTVNLLGATTITGTVGSATGAIRAVTIGSAVSSLNATVSFGGNVVATTVTIFGTSVASFASGANLTAAVDGGAAVTGTLTLLGGSTVTGLVGSVASLNTINAGAASASNTFTAAVSASKINVTSTGTVQFNALATFDTLNFAGDGVVTVISGIGLTGAITNTTTSNGTLNLTGNSTVTGAVGSTGTGLKLINSTATFGDTTTITGNVKATTISLGGTGKTVFSGTVAATTLNFGTDGEATVASGKSVTITNINNTVSNQGTLNLSGNTTITATIGSTGAGLKQLNLNAVAGDTITVAGAVTASNLNVNTAGGVLLQGNVTGNVNLNAAATVQLSADKIVTGPIFGNAGGTFSFLGGTTLGGSVGTLTSTLGTVNFLAGTANIGQSINSTAVSVTGTTIFKKTANTVNSGAFTFGGGSTLNLDTYATTVTGSITINAGGTIRTTLTSGSTAGTASATGVVTIPSTTNIYVNVPSSYTVVDGQTIRLINGTGGGATVASIATGLVTTDSAVLSFAGRAGTDNGISSTTGEDLYIVATRLAGGFATAGGISASAPAAGAISVLNTIAAAGNATGDMLTVANTFNSYSAAQLRTELPKLAPLPAGAATSAAAAAASAGLSAVGSRFASLRGDTQLADSNSTGTGISGGDKGRDQAFWIKAFGSTGKQTAYDGYDGFGVNSGGFAVGADTDMAGDWRVGGAYTYGDTTVSQNDARTGDRTKVKTNQLTIYGMKEMGDMYVDTMAAYAVHKKDSTRGAPLSRTATASYDADQWTLRVGGGYRMPMGGGTVVTPLASLEYMSLKTNAYTESGAGALNLAVQGKTSSGFKSGLGVRVSGDSNWGGTAVKPELHALWSYNFGDDRVDSTSSFTGGGAAFNTVGQKIDRNSYDLGGGVAFLPNKTSKITVVYNYDTRKNYGGHAVSLTGRWNF